jgi:signal transduction histidine kinase
MDADLRADVLNSMQSVFLAIALPVILLALLGGTLLAYRALRPARQLVHTFQDIIETGDVHTRAPAENMRGEFAEMVHLFNRMLARIERLVTGMRDTLDNVAHDLRTPMTRLRGRAEMALQHADDPEALRTALADTLEASDAVLDTLDAIMDVAEAEAGAIQLDQARVPVADLARDVVEAYDLVAETKAIALDVDVPSGLTVRVDRGRMRQALANLIDNAVKYTPEGGRVHLRAFREDATVVIAVADDGIGIDPEAQPHIWDRLYRADASRSEPGLGLGLSLVKAIVEAHGGHVDVESAPGAGSVFRVRLPAADASPSA